MMDFTPANKFKQCDLNEDGVIDFNEMLAYGEKIGNQNATDLKLHFKKMDENGNSFIDLFELDLKP